MIFAICLVFGLVACGGGNNETGNNETTEAKKASLSGRYTLCAIDMDGEHMDEATLTDFGLLEMSVLEFNEDGTGAWILEGDEVAIVYNDREITDPEGVESIYKYELKDDQLVLYLDEGVTYYHKLAS